MNEWITIFSYKCELQIDIQIEEARHPLLEIQSNIQYIPNNYSLKGNVHPSTGVNSSGVHDDDDEKSQNVVIVTGPNMGGKSTYMRQVRLFDDILLPMVNEWWFIYTNKYHSSFTHSLIHHHHHPHLFIVGHSYYYGSNRLFRPSLQGRLPSIYSSFHSYRSLRQPKPRRVHLHERNDRHVEYSDNLSAEWWEWK